MEKKVKILVVVTNGTEDIEAIVPVDLFRRAGFEVVVSGDNNQVKFARGTKIIVDSLLSEIHSSDNFDMIYLPGGADGVHNLLENQQLSLLLQNFDNNGKLISAICAAPLLLVKNNIIKKNSTITSHPSIKPLLSEFNYSEEPIVVSGNIITSRGAGTSIDFALKIIEILKDSETANKISNDIVYLKPRG